MLLLRGNRKYNLMTEGKEEKAKKVVEFARIIWNLGKWQTRTINEERKLCFFFFCVIFFFFLADVVFFTLFNFFNNILKAMSASSVPTMHFLPHIHFLLIS